MRLNTLIFEYVCAVCWSPLIEDIDKHSAVCAKYGLDHAGYHRKSGVEWQREHGEYSKQEVINNYQDIPPYSYMLGLATPPHHIGLERLQRNRRALGRDDSGI